MAAPPKECPFAKAGELVELAKEKCPAFQEGCPFSETKTPVEIRASLQKMPPSHTSKSHAVHAAVARTRANSLTDQSGDDVLVDEWLGWWASHTDVDIENQISSDDGLASRLKKGTEQAHEEAENVAFVKLLLKGKAPLESYVALIAALKPIYGALEKAADRVSRTCPAVARVCDDTLPQLRRYESLEADLAYYRRRCPDVTKRAEAFARRSKATSEYVASLDSWPTTGPKAEALVAHLYTRYLGDLSGGQILRRAAVRAYGLTPPGGTTLDAVDGVRFYDFRLIGKPTKLRRFKDEYRRRLDDLRVADASLVVDEAVAAFRRNTQLLKELDFVVLGATEAAARHARPTKPKAQGQCPFLAKEDIAALPFKECPVTGESVSASRASSTRRRFNAADIAVVAFFALGMVFLIHRATPSGVMLPGP
jgi:heme oxygenase